MNASPLKAMFWKECRENARWAALALLALSLGLVYAWFRLPSGPALPQIWSGENLVLTITTPLIGLALGLLQIMPELRRDQWAFLIHRPASRTTLFFGKVLPGLCLYLVATALPLLGLAIWAASPSHVPAPFDFRFTLAGWAAILAGLPFYFAGLLVALRPARWYGSRALPVLTALLAPAAAASFYEFWTVALVCFLVTAVLGTAAWGSFLTAGEYKEQTKPARFALGLALYPAVLVLGVGALMLTFGTYRAVSQSRSEWWRNEQKIDTQGRIYSFSEHGLDLQHQENKTVTITDLSGHPVAPSMWQNLKQQHKLMDMLTLFVRQSASDYAVPYQDSSRYVLLLGNDDGTGESNWYYSRRFRQIVRYIPIIGTSPAGGAWRAQFLGPNGRADAPEQAGRFPNEMPYPSSIPGLNVLRFRYALYHYDLTRGTAGLLRDAPTSGGVQGTVSTEQYGTEQYAGVDAASRPTDEPPVVYFVAADGQITVYTRTGLGIRPEATRKLFTTPIAFRVPTYVQVAVTPDRSRFFFWYSPDSTRRLPDHLVTVSDDGRVLKTEALPLAPIPAGAARRPTPLDYAPSLLLPPVAVPIAAAYAYVAHHFGWLSADGLWYSREAFLPAFLGACFSGLLAAVLAWLISRRLGDGRRGRLAWAFGVFWLGGYGVLLLLALRPWPARLPCPNCGRERVVDNEACEHCGGAWARPKRDGTEIFDAEGQEAAAR